MLECILARSSFCLRLFLRPFFLWLVLYSYAALEQICLMLFFLPTHACAECLGYGVWGKTRTGTCGRGGGAKKQKEKGEKKQKQMKTRQVRNEQKDVNTR